MTFLKKLWRWSGWALGIILGLLIALAATGAIYQLVASARDRRDNPPPGQLIDVGGYKMHIDCTGQGSPTVILESGLADTWLAWYKVQPEISKVTRVCSYDRAGMGWSDTSPNARDAETIAKELHTLLDKAGIRGPYVMVGHSLGGMFVRMYTHLYPDEVLGVVLVDSTHPDQFERFPHSLTTYNDQFLRKEGWKEDTMPFGLPRLMHWCGKGAEELRPMLRTIDCQLKPWHEHMAEYNAWNTSTAEVRAAGSLGDRPLVVLSHDPHPKSSSAYDSHMDGIWNDLQDELTHLSTNGTRVIAAGSSHMIQLDRPDVVIAAIQKVLTECRQRQVLDPASR